MKNIIAAVSLIVPSIIFAQEQRAPELPNLAAFNAGLKDVPAPAAVAAAALPTAKAPSCPILDLNGAVAGHALFGSTYHVAIGKEKVADISSEGDGYELKDARGNLMAKSTPTAHPWGTKSSVTDCAGNPIGVIQEEYTKDGSNFTVEDAQGNPIANTGWTEDDSITLKDINGQAIGAVTGIGGLGDKFSISASKADPRVVAILGRMNVEAGYHRSRDNRSDRMIDHEPHGGGGRRY